MHRYKMLLSLSLIATLTACGGGGDSTSGSSGTATTTTGTISGFGSIVINGVHYETDEASVRYDDGTTSVSGLSAGQVVTLSGRTDDSGRHHALSVIYDSAVVGPVTAVDGNANSFVALGQTVLVNTSTIYVNATGLGDISSGASVRVSGDRDASGNIVAGYVQLLASTPASYRLSGSIANLSGSRFSIGGETIDASTATLQPSDTTLANGLRVAVTGTLDSSDSSGATLLASKVRVRKVLDGAQGGSRGEVEGIITSASATDANSGSFTIDGTVVYYDASTVIEKFRGTASTAELIAGTRVEAHGTLNSDGSLQATRIQVQRQITTLDGQLGYLLGTLSADPDTGAGSISLLGTTVLIDSSTVFVDRSNRANQMFSLADLAAGSLVQVAVSVQNGTLSALKVALPRYTPDYSAVGGPFAAVNSSAYTLTVSSVPVRAQSECTSVQGRSRHHGGDALGRVTLDASCTLYFVHGQQRTQAQYFAALADSQNASASVMALGSYADGQLSAALLDLQPLSQSGDLSQEAD
ncbi:hypothetical protein SAMN04488038_10752 [Solimonas aquatica]|uniref:DUF5666 domain-containing protein n=1 Tax=Solimonas aquatica TaxID=489703 RepID=A0A1H9GFF7_9GAMM|nr:DUF5666 domain-containing protein [Solimonas aquatica]SEQ48842.1 hypothetical protein SAMN04488038_10752 [Solimonas aquatica]